MIIISLRTSFFFFLGPFCGKSIGCWVLTEIFWEDYFLLRLEFLKALCVRFMIYIVLHKVLLTAQCHLQCLVNLENRL